jgi:D-sedoheptulose 7-phosphate isomerase
MSDLYEIIQGHFQDSIATKIESADLMTPLLIEASERIVACLMMEGKVLVCGNGGSAANAQHFAAKMVGRFEKERPGLAAISLGTDSSILTAIANDYDFDMVYSKQVRAIGHSEDILLVFSTSGDSQNVIQAIYAAHERNMVVIAMNGKGGGQIGELLAPEDIHFCVPSSRTARIQEVHILLVHALCDAIDYTLLGGET